MSDDDMLSRLQDIAYEATVNNCGRVELWTRELRWLVDEVVRLRGEVACRRCGSRMRECFCDG